MAVNRLYLRAFKCSEVLYYLAKLWDVEGTESQATRGIPLRMGTDRYLDTLSTYIDCEA